MDKSDSKSRWKSFFPTLILTVAVAFPSHIVIELLAHGHVTKGTAILMAVCIGFVFERVMHNLGGRSREIRRLVEEYHVAMTEMVPMVSSIRDISSQQYSAALQRHFVDQQLPGQLNRLFSEWQKRISLRHKWRLIFELHLKSEVTAITSNSLSLPLETYLEILLDFIQVSIDEANDTGATLTVRSFTNAGPRDWFDRTGAPSAADEMEDYCDRLQAHIETMRESGHRYERHVLCSETLGGYGFSDIRSVEKEWIGLSSDERERYYSVHSEGKDGSYYVALDDDIAFCEDHTEYIYFGFLRNGVPTWEWCFCCLFTNNNLNVSASFIDMGGQEALRHVIDVENSKHRKPENAFTPPARFQVGFQEFPDLIDNGQIGKTRLFKTISPLATKWHRAALIWHDENEADMLAKYLGNTLAGNASILDCACGTGFHARMLSSLGYDVTASDIDPENIEILKHSDGYKQSNIPVKVADWKTLSRSFRKKKFDCVLCLGSSITYYDSWKEGRKVEDFNSDELKAVLSEMKSILAPGGILIIGVSRHYDRKLDSFDCTFSEREIDGVRHGMEWKLNYDWIKGKKHWLCNIWNENDEDYSFELSSSLFDAEQLSSLCGEIFGNDQVSVNDVDSGYYDTLVVSRSP